LRKIVGDIFGKESREQRDAVKLQSLTPEKIEAWRIDFIRRKSTDPLAEKSAEVSANSFILCARALFGVKTLARVRDAVELPEPLPFSGVKAERIRLTRYRSGFDMMAVLAAARQELATAKPEQFKIFLLASMAGLRRNEIDKLEWTSFRWDEGLIRIEATNFFRPKSHTSEGDVLVDPELMQVFRGYHARTHGPFVIESARGPDSSAPYGVYRCDPDFDELIGWLRRHGINSKTPLHTLRKEYGSQINARFGLTAAQEMLRHADVAVTAAHYVENKQRAVLGFGQHLLTEEKTIVPIAQAS
jgi:integrase